MTARTAAKQKHAMTACTAARQSQHGIDKEAQL
jgi:hypothetical protein